MSKSKIVLIINFGSDEGYFLLYILTKSSLDPK